MASPEDRIDPIQRFYMLGYSDAKTGKRSRVVYMYKLAYVSGRYDAVTNKPPRY
jgi:hypothetical protein